MRLWCVSVYISLNHHLLATLTVSLVRAVDRLRGDSLDLRIENHTSISIMFAVIDCASEKATVDESNKTMAGLS